MPGVRLEPPITPGHCSKLRSCCSDLPVNGADSPEQWWSVAGVGGGDGISGPDEKVKNPEDRTELELEELDELGIMMNEKN
jgi:hypothetical protein